jgi:WD40 repeat protein
MDGAISVYETSTGQRVHQLAPVRIVRELWPCLHPTAPFVACSSYFHREVQVRDLRSGAVVATATPPWPGGSYACWSPDGRTLLVADSNDSGIIHDYAFDSAAPASRLVRNIQGRATGGVQITFNPAGDRFVSRGWDKIAHLFDAVSGQLLFSTPPGITPASGILLRFDHTGQRLAGARVGDRKDRIGVWSVADAREYRSLVPAENGANGRVNGLHHGTFVVHPGGRLAAASLTDGVVLFDLDTGHELAHLAISPRACSVVFDGTGDLLTNGFEGFFRWPVRADAANPSRLTIGPPERLPFHPGSHPIATSHDGRVIAQ